MKHALIPWGKPYNNGRKAFLAALTKAKIEDSRFHDPRHSLATFALLKSKDIKTVRELLGYSRIERTSKYAHVLLGQNAGVIDKVGGEVRFRNSGRGNGIA